MRFFSPPLLTLLPIALALPFIWIMLEKRARARFSRFASEQLLPMLVSNPQKIHARRRTRILLGALALTFAILALARPQLGVREETMPSQGLDLVFLLDVSNSMLAEDTVPNRLKKAKHVIRNFVDRLSGDRVGIVAFAGSAYPAVPLTTDYDFVRQSIDTLDENAISNQGSDLGKALDVAYGLLARGGLSDPDEESSEDAQAGSRVVVIVSDGEATEGDESKLVPKLKEKGVRVYAIGVGSLKGAPIPMRDPGGYMRGYKKDPAGNMVLTKLESANLEGIASKTDGKYYSASTNEGEVEEIIGNLSSLDRSVGEGRRVVVYDEVFQYPLALSVFFFLLMILLRENPAKIRTLAFIALALMSGSVARATESLSEYRDTQRGLEAYQEKDYAAATQHFGKAQANNPEAMAHHMNLGDALLRAGSAEGAIAEFNHVLKSKDGNEAARGAFNIGKAHDLGKNHEQAIRAYQQGLDRLAGDPKADPEVVLRLKRALENAQQQKQQKQDQQQQQKDQQDQDKDKKEQNEGDKDKDQQQQNKEQAKPQGSKRKPEFKAEKLSEGDAKRIMQQLQEQEKKSQQRMMRGKTAKPKDDKNTKDW